MYLELLTARSNKPPQVELAPDTSPLPPLPPSLFAGLLMLSPHSYFPTVPPPLPLAHRLARFAVGKRCTHACRSRWIRGVLRVDCHNLLLEPTHLGRDGLAGPAVMTTPACGVGGSVSRLTIATPPFGLGLLRLRPRPRTVLSTTRSPYPRLRSESDDDLPLRSGPPLRVLERKPGGRQATASARINRFGPLFSSRVPLLRPTRHSSAPPYANSMAV